MTDLKPCPFCGGEAEIVDAIEAGENARVVCCKKCMASSRVIFALMDDVTFDLVSAWNTRVLDLDALIAAGVKAGLEMAADICDQERHNLNALTVMPPQSAAAVASRNIIRATSPDAIASAVAGVKGEAG